MLTSVHHVDIRSAAPVLKSWKAVAKWKNTKCVKRASLCYAKTGLRRDCWVWNECATLARWCSPWAVLTSTWGIAHTYQCSANAVLPAFYEENMESMMVIARWRTWCVLAVPTTWGKTEKSTWKPLLDRIPGCPSPPAALSHQQYEICFAEPTGGRCLPAPRGPARTDHFWEEDPHHNMLTFKTKDTLIKWYRGTKHSMVQGNKHMV